MTLAWLGPSEKEAPVMECVQHHVSLRIQDMWVRNLFMGPANPICQVGKVVVIVEQTRCRALIHVVKTRNLKFKRCPCKMLRRCTQECFGSFKALRMALSMVSQAVKIHAPTKFGFGQRTCRNHRSFHMKRQRQERCSPNELFGTFETIFFSGCQKSLFCFTKSVTKNAHLIRDLIRTFGFK